MRACDEYRASRQYRAKWVSFQLLNDTTFKEYCHAYRILCISSRLQSRGSSGDDSIRMQQESIECMDNWISYRGRRQRAIVGGANQLSLNVFGLSGQRHTSQTLNSSFRFVTSTFERSIYVPTVDTAMQQRLIAMITRPLSDTESLFLFHRNLRQD